MLEKSDNIGLDGMKFHAFDIIWDNKMVERIKDNDAIPQANHTYTHTMWKIRRMIH